MEYKIEGKILPLLKVKLLEGEEIVAEPGFMAWMTDNVEMNSEMVGGVGKTLKRAITQESILLVTFNAENGNGFVTFSSSSPGEMIPLELRENEEYICQKDAFVCGERSVKVEPFLLKDILTGIAGGEGFILQRIKGPGKVFVYLEGVANEKKLETGQKLKVKYSNIGIFEKSCKMSTKFSGIMNTLFSQQGIFFVVIEGPGTVWLQSYSEQRGPLPIPSSIVNIPKIFPKL